MTFTALVRAMPTESSARTFKGLAAAWIASEGMRKGRTAAYQEEVAQSLANHLCRLDALPISTIVAAITAPMLSLVETNAPAMEEKVSKRLHAIMDYAVETGAIVANPLPRRRWCSRLAYYANSIAHLLQPGNLDPIQTGSACPVLASRYGKCL